MMMSQNTFLMGGRSRAAPLPAPAPAPTPAPPEPDTMTWGAPTWFLLHAMAEKVRPERFDEIREDMLNVIYSICTNLPCPFCSEHAKAHLTKSRFRHVRTPIELKDFLFDFHNMVNARKHRAPFPREELDGKYSAALWIPIINSFLLAFQEKSTDRKYLADELYRSRLRTKLREWFYNNLPCFM